MSRPGWWRPDRCASLGSSIHRNGPPLPLFPRTKSAAQSCPSSRNSCRDRVSIPIQSCTSRATRPCGSLPATSLDSTGVEEVPNAPHPARCDRARGGPVAAQYGVRPVDDRGRGPRPVRGGASWSHGRGCQPGAHREEPHRRQRRDRTVPHHRSAARQLRADVFAARVHDRQARGPERLGVRRDRREQRAARRRRSKKP